VAARSRHESAARRNHPQLEALHRVRLTLLRLLRRAIDR
jgi:hypothetical protein